MKARLWRSNLIQLYLYLELLFGIMESTKAYELNVISLGNLNQNG